MTTPWDSLDQSDPLAPLRAAFHIPEGVIYLDGNSLGCLPHAVIARLQTVVADEWGTSLIRGWNDHSWIDLPARVGDKIAKLIGAPAASVVAADSTSVNLTKALSAGLQMRPDRRVILSDRGNFPADLYIAQGLARAFGADYELRLVEPEDVEAALDDSIAVMMITHVDYRSGRMHDMARLTARAHEVGAIALWDLAHSAGALPVDVTAAHIDLAVGCGYKYLNGGPGAPAFVYVRPDHLPSIAPFLSGWMGHAAPFDFDLAYRPAEGIERMTVGTPPILGLSALDAALDVWEGVDMAAVRAKSMALGDLFIREVEARCAAYGLNLASPRDAQARGSQVSFHCPNGYAVMRALISEGVIGDFRQPDVIRFGFTPLYLRYGDVGQAAQTLERVLRDGLWRDPSFQTRAKVT